MSQIETQIKLVNEKLEQLLRQYNTLQKEHIKLQQTAQDLQINNEQHLHNIQQLHLQISVLKAAAGSMEDVDRKAFDKQISQYVKEIDKCIALLSE